MSFLRRCFFAIIGKFIKSYIEILKKIPASEEKEQWLDSFVVIWSYFWAARSNPRLKYLFTQALSVHNYSSLFDNLSQIELRDRMLDVVDFFTVNDSLTQEEKNLRLSNIESITYSFAEHPSSLPFFFNILRQKRQGIITL